MTRAVVLDLDGTLVDSAPDIARALTCALTAHGLPGIDTDRVRALLGGGAEELVRGALDAVGGDPALAGPVLDAYSRAYRAEPAAATTVHADAREALQSLRDKGIRIGVCTNKRTGLSHDVLAATGLAPLVDVVVGIDAVPAGKPDPGHLQAALTALEVSPPTRSTSATPASTRSPHSEPGCPIGTCPGDARSPALPPSTPSAHWPRA
ncbi:HAD family hydrolase [Prauserella oleivorans]